MSLSSSVQKSPAASLSASEKFTRLLLLWNREENDRAMPWKGEENPYRIWLSEIILQQTRVEQGLKYYEKFISTFPDIQSLASAPPEKVFKLWEGLGYYSRCRNLIHTAKFISEHLDGNFPEDYDSILQLKGVGSYTAAAIASFAYNLPHAVLDGNVFRVLSRVFNIETPIDSPEGKKQFSELARLLLPAKQAGEYNQAIMDFGALICKPAPLCGKCVLREHCQAYLLRKQDVLPIKIKRPVLRKRWFHYYITTCGEYFLLHKRKEKDIWQHLYDAPLIETDHPVNHELQLQLYKDQYGFNQFSVVRNVKKEQKLTHQLLHIELFHIELKEIKDISGYSWVHVSTLDQFAFPKTLQSFLEDIGL